MKRLTRKTNGKDYCSYCHQVEFDNEVLERKDDIIEPQDFYNKYPYQSIGNEEEILNKLGAIEDLQEQLGIDLITLFKALKEGFYCIDLDNQDIRKFKAPLCFNSTSNQFYWYGSNIGYCDLKDCGKTWSLDRSELEND